MLSIVSESESLQKIRIQARGQEDFWEEDVPICWLDELIRKDKGKLMAIAAESGYDVIDEGEGGDKGYWIVFNKQ